MGDYLIVALSTDEFNAGKGKKAYHTYETRKKMLEAIRYVDLVIPEESDKFDYLKDYCELVFLDRTPGVSTTQIKKDLGLQEAIVGVDQLPGEPEE